MKYIKPGYYDKFRCIAQECPDTCCAGWQIVIDEESLERYSSVKGEFGRRLANSIDWRESAFKQKKGRCSFLNSDGLCDIYRELGETALCRTCSMYPRHVEEFDGLRELSLSLSCPVAAGMILTCKDTLPLSEEETGEEEELAEEFEDFDIFLFTQLQDARNVIFQLLKEKTLSVDERLNGMLVLAWRMQCCVDEERFFDLDEVIGSFGKDPAEYVRCGTDEKKSRYDRMREEYKVLYGLERLRPEWTAYLLTAERVLYNQREAVYGDICREFSEQFANESADREQWNLFQENLALFFVYTYFCGAVYDDWIYSKAALAEFSVRWIKELIMAMWVAQKREKKFSWKLCIEISYRFAREIEHSDENLNLLEEYLEKPF